MLNESIQARRSRWLSPRRLALLAAAVVVLVVVAFYAPLPFVPSLWNVSTNGTTFQTRYRIADHLASSGRLIGMTQSEVIDLLGPPTDTDKFRDHSLVYVLGPERGFVGIDYEWLLVDTGPDGRVQAAAVTSD